MAKIISAGVLWTAAWMAQQGLHFHGADPPGDAQSVPEVLVAASGRRIINPPQVNNLPRKLWHTC